MRRLCPLILAVLVLGCRGNDNPVARAAGSWPGHFSAESIDGKTDAESLKAETMKGNLELYTTGMKFLLEMSTAHQSFTIKGKWKAEKERITMTADSFDFENPKEEDQKALGLKLIKPEEIRGLFGHPFVLDESSDKRHLKGLKTSFGRLIGNFEFERPLPH
jgi:hypothetical protein